MARGRRRDQCGTLGSNPWEPDNTVNVSYSIRRFILGPDDTLYRLASAKFSRIVDDPESHRLERFAGQRVRMAEVIVELRDRAPCAR